MYFLFTEFKKNSGKTTSKGGSGEETTAKRGHHFAEGNDENCRQFFWKI